MSSERIVSTLSTGAPEGLERALDALGVTFVHRPLLTFETDAFGPALGAAISALDQFQAVALTSPRSADLYAGAVREAHAVSPPLWASGPTTARELQPLAQVHMVEPPAPDGAAAALARMMIGQGVTGPVLFPCGEQHRDVLPGRLRAAGIEVTEVVCYRAVIAPPAELRAAAASGDMILVGSGRVAQALADAVPASERPGLVAVGPVTTRAAASAGWPAAATVEEFTVPLLLQAVRAVLQLAQGAR